MPAFNFKKQFVEPIQAGTKHHTIRAMRKDGRLPAKTGDALSLFCGMRTKGCFRILPETVPCTRIEPLRIDANGDIAIGEVYLDGDERWRLAVADGFIGYAEMLAFWEGRLPFKGYIIHWK